jgi:hypothetical protein
VAISSDSESGSEYAPSDDAAADQEVAARKAKVSRKRASDAAPSPRMSPTSVPAAAAVAVAKDAATSSEPKPTVAANPTSKLPSGSPVGSIRSSGKKRSRSLESSKSQSPAKVAAVGGGAKIRLSAGGGKSTPESFGSMLNEKNAALKKEAKKPKKYTPLEEQFIALKRANRDAVLAVEVGYKCVHHVFEVQVRAPYV